jgi:hypothetical protein
MEQRVKGTLEIWANSFTLLRVPKVFHLRRDPYERADVSPTPITTGRCREPIFASLYSRAGASLCREIPGDLQNVSPGRNRGASPSAGRWRRWRNRLSRLQGENDWRRPTVGARAGANVRFGSLADIPTSPRHIRFTPNNGSWAAHPSLHLVVGL